MMESSNVLREYERIIISFWYILALILCLTGNFSLVQVTYEIKPFNDDETWDNAELLKNKKRKKDTAWQEGREAGKEAGKEEGGGWAGRQVGG
jgi:hypothetical protein